MRSKSRQCVFICRRAITSDSNSRLLSPLSALQTVIGDLTRSLDEPQDSANLQIAVFSFINAIINYKAGEVMCISGAARL